MNFAGRLISLYFKKVGRKSRLLALSLLFFITSPLYSQK
ncbi:hypothetical protein CHCC20441_0260 [Bacillus licheniformis]|uniref:Uncharacterized protein n=1 Tax=Bacillus licheniformis TaxID=1402 RepID=A0A8B5YCW5_BACLI|nr:hypothetical protein B4092_0435 [Bacillus licheniformis]TWN08657.1 hypothetical protein CHCC14564_2389 [Bacillus licheniformis LMG 17339]KYC77415.1 hypothetical protein B4090_0632 [Bacillus licheniformis]KYC79598.1 hypothetical protein B4091_0564 [Bacillus licheniformis]KYC94214.1 hypothetical protein B4164_0563 [Bacillus licheniformis]